MKLTDDLPKWIAWPLRLVLYAFVMLILFNIGLSFMKGRVANNSMECSTIVAKNETALMYAKNMVTCLRQKNGILENWLMSSVYRAIDALPNAPKEFVGTWNASQPRCSYRHELRENGEFTSEPQGCGLSSATFHGVWGVYDHKMIWLPDESTVWPPDINSIDAVDGDFFLLLEQDGSRTKFSRAKFQPETTASQATSGESLSTVASAGSEPPQPPPNASMMSVDHRHGRVWLSDYVGNKGGAYRRWDPAKGDEIQVRLPSDFSDFFPSAILDIRDGNMLLGVRKGTGAPFIVLVTPQNEIRGARLTIMRNKPYLMELRDGSVLVMGGILGDNGEKKTFTNAVERISFSDNTLLSFSDDTLSVERLPDIPGEIRRGVSLVELSDGRVMALGGSSSQYVGHEPITAETYFLDITTKSWQTGPKMAEARANATAMLLPDGNVLIAGGWTPKNTWNDTPTRTTELWDFRSNGFVSGNLLPLGIANHQAIWMPNHQGKQLLLVGGWVRAWSGNQSVVAFDVDSRLWRTVGEQCKAHERTGELMAVPFEYNGSPFVWCQTPSIGWNLVPLRLSPMGPNVLSHIDPDKGIALHRYGMTFLPPNANSPGLAVGGAVDGADSAAVDAIWLDGRIQGLAPLNHARHHAKVFRLQDGSILVVGGKGGDLTRRTEHVPPIELLPAGVPLDQARWIDVNLDAQSMTEMGLLGDSSLLAMRPTGEVERLVITVSNNKAAVQRNTFPPLNRRRITSNGPGDEISVRELPDGRIIVLGGRVQYHRIALLTEDVLRADSSDRFVDIGETTPALDYEIYDPATKSWSESVPSRATFSSAAILDDGAVVKWGLIEETADPWEQNRNPSSNHVKTALEISSTDGKEWGRLKEQAPPLVASDVVQQAPGLFVIDGELFLFGKHPTDVTPYYWRGNAMVQWFNTSAARWETLWESGANDSWRDHIGRIIIRSLPNGKRIALPVGGLSGNGSGG